MTTSSRNNAFNRANVTNVLCYPSKSDAPIITIWELTDIEVFERYCKDSCIFRYPNDDDNDGMACVKERVPDSYDGCTLRYHQYESVGKATNIRELGSP